MTFKEENTADALGDQAQLHLAELTAEKAAFYEGKLQQSPEEKVGTVLALSSEYFTLRLALVY